MTLDQAITQISACAEQMRAQYGKAVFDEWAVVALQEENVRILTYSGPRKEGFKKNFQTDSGALLEGLLNGDYNPGDFEFARHGVGTGFESFLVLGRGLYLICNNTERSMDEIAKDPKWLGAQVPFAELSERFRSDPLLV